MKMDRTVTTMLVLASALTVARAWVGWARTQPPIQKESAPMKSPAAQPGVTDAKEIKGTVQSVDRAANAMTLDDGIILTIPPVSWIDDAIAEIVVSEAIVLLVCATACGLLVVALEALDLWRERRAEMARQVHTRIATALHRDPLLGRLSVTPIVHVPRFGWSPATIELRGRVPTPWLRHAVLRAVERAAASQADSYHILDQIAVVPSMHLAAA